MVQLTKTASRLLSRVKNEKWASSDDHEDPIEIEEAFINADPLSSSDGEDANERANIAPSRFTYPARRNAPVAKEHSKKSPRITENEDTREDGSIREIGAAKKAEYKLPDQLQYGRDDVVFGAQGAKPSKRTRKTFINIHATASTVDSTNKNVGPGKLIREVQAETWLTVYRQKFPTATESRNCSSPEQRFIQSTTISLRKIWRRRTRKWGF